MRPSHGEPSDRVAAEVLAEVLSVLSQMGVVLGATDVKMLTDRVEAKLARLRGETKAGRPAE